jgi:hypothetical protein
MAVNPSLWKVAIPEDVAATSPRARGDEGEDRIFALFRRPFLTLEIRRLVSATWIDTSNCH